ncbi:unnamed protein product, partial [marine sediment metagenome]
PANPWAVDGGPNGGDEPPPTVSEMSGAPTYTLALGTINVSNNLTIGDGTNEMTATADANDTVLNVDGDVTISANSTLTASGSAAFNVGGSWSNAGTFTAGTGTVTFDAGASGKTLAGAMIDTSAFYDLTFNNGSGGWTLSNDIKVTHVLDINAGTFNASNTTIELSGDDTPFVKTGTFNYDTSTVKYTSGEDTNITAATYYILELESAGGGDGGWTVTGAGAVGYNGDYTENGTEGGKAAYRLDDTHWLYWMPDAGPP